MGSPERTTPEMRIALPSQGVVFVVRPDRHYVRSVASGIKPEGAPIFGPPCSGKLWDPELMDG